jgi:hypothetical protein
MTAPFRDPDELSSEKAGSNYHDEDQEIQDDEAPGQGHRSARPATRPKADRRRPPPRKRHYEDD